MRNRLPFSLAVPHPPRRRFVQGLAAGGVLASLPSFVGSALAAVGQGSAAAAPVLSGENIDLVVAETAVNFTGTPRMATTINGSIPAPTLRCARAMSHHPGHQPAACSDLDPLAWNHPALPDGRRSRDQFCRHRAGRNLHLSLPIEQSGTYWYHSHSGMQEITGMYGTIIIEPRDGETIRADRDFVVQLSDWTDQDPMQVFAKLKTQSDYYNYHQPTAVEFFRDASREGLQAAISKRQMWNEMRMSPTDLADLSAATLTYLMNGTTPAGNWTGLFRPGERLRLRFVNGAGNTSTTCASPASR
jgi:CopA family copper-resistance protein